MGRKVHPVGFRLGVIRDWQAKWYAEDDYAQNLKEDMLIRNSLLHEYRGAGVSQVEIERQANKVTVAVHTSRPGMVIGRGGQRVEQMKRRLSSLTGKAIQLDILEIQQPEVDAYLVACSVADQLERRVSQRRAMKQALSRTMQAGGQGIKIRCSGRLGGAEIARSQEMHQGRIPLQTLRADVDYGLAEAHTAMGRIGVKVWIYRGDVFPEVEEELTEGPGFGSISTQEVEGKVSEGTGGEASSAPEGEPQGASDKEGLDATTESS